MSLQPNENNIQTARELLRASIRKLDSIENFDQFNFELLVNVIQSLRVAERSLPATQEPMALANLLSAVLRHPDAPKEITDGIQNAMCDIGYEVDMTSPDFIERVLAGETINQGGVH